MKQFITAMAMCALLLCTVSIRPAHAGEATDSSGKASQDATKKAAAKKIKCIAPVNMSNGTVLPEGKFSAGIKYIYVHMDSLYENDDEKNGEYGGKYDRVNQAVQLSAKAGLFKNFEARIMVPFWDKQVKRKPGNLAKPWDTDEVSGLGDVVVMGRYGLMTQRDGDWLNFAVGAGVKMPTGETDHENCEPYSRTHKYIGPSGQLSAGSWDPKLEMGATKVFGRSRVDAHMMYTFAGEGAHDSHLGDRFTYDIGYGYAVSEDFDLELEFNGVDQQRHWFDHTADYSSGGQTMYLTPGVHWKFMDNGHFSLGVPVVVYRDLNGTTNTPERASRYGLGEDFKIVTRLGFSF